MRPASKKATYFPTSVPLLIDLTSMAVMKVLGVNDIITGDEHFEHVGMGFQRKP